VGKRRRSAAVGTFQAITMTQWEAKNIKKRQQEENRPETERARERERERKPGSV